MAKTRFIADGNDVTIEYDDATSGERVTETYFVPHSVSGQPMYVRIRDKAGRYPQVCAGLASTGSTLSATPQTLLSVIKREYKAMRAAERREESRYALR